MKKSISVAVLFCSCVASSIGYAQACDTKVIIPGVITALKAETGGVNAARSKIDTALKSGNCTPQEAAELKKLEEYLNQRDIVDGNSAHEGKHSSPPQTTAKKRAGADDGGIGLGKY